MDVARKELEKLSRIREVIDTGFVIIQASSLETTDLNNVLNKSIEGIFHILKDILKIIRPESPAHNS
ncbi:MAG: hypothetical protein O3C63_04680 [Cyanobacteria bacterium]|nr:hypothetical protein [Cyanobacteriota bacterium]MDA1020678.1 hypothetical protein [Cyanobacteriota bacterium]